VHTIIVIVRRGLLSNLINRLPEKEISSIAEYIAKNETKDFVLLLRNEYNIESALDVIETWIKISGYPYRHEVNYTLHSYVIQHDMGKNWSLYMAELYRFLFEEFGLKRVEFDIPIIHWISLLMLKEERHTNETSWSSFSSVVY
jgi:ADP-heptose:LPS heptosyltransferase